MPTYIVTAPGFYEGKLYEPDGKRTRVRTPSVLSPCPSWLSPEKEVAQDSSPDDVKASDLKDKLTELGVEFKGNASKQALQLLLDGELAKREQDAQNKRDIDAAVNFIEAPHLSGPVQVL